MPPDIVREEEKTKYREDLTADTPVENHRVPTQLLDQFSNQDPETINRLHCSVHGSRFEVNLNTHCKLNNFEKKVLN